MAIFKRSAYVLAAAAFFSAPAAAQVTISGTTAGCFYLTTVCLPSTNDAGFAPGLTFTGNSFSVVSNGTNDVQLTGADRLGVFTMANPTNFNFTGWKFALFVTITSPAITSPAIPQTYLAVLDPFNTTSGDKLDINFGIDTYLYTYNGGVFTLQADAIQNLRLGNSQDLTGKTACNIRVGDETVRCGPDQGGNGGGGTTSVVPEPSTYLLMATGLMGLGIAARRRRNS